MTETPHARHRCSPTSTMSPRGWPRPATCPTPQPPPRFSSPTGWASRCWSRDRPASARPNWPAPSPRPPARVWCACSATRVSTRPARSTSGTTPSRSCASRRGHGDWDQTKTDVFSEEFLLTRPLLTAIRRTEPTVLLIDETDKADIEIEGLLLEVLSDFAVTVPELGTITADAHPVRGADLQRHPRAVRGAQAPLPVPAHRLPRSRPRAAHPALAGARTAGVAGRRTGPHHRRAARHAAQEAAVGGRDHRLGPHHPGAGPGHHRRRHHRRDAGRGPQAPVRPDSAPPASCGSTRSAMAVRTHPPAAAAGPARHARPSRRASWKRFAPRASR